MFTLASSTSCWTTAFHWATVLLHGDLASAVGFWSSSLSSRFWSGMATRQCGKDWCDDGCSIKKQVLAGLGLLVCPHSCSCSLTKGKRSVVWKGGKEWAESAGAVQKFFFKKKVGIWSGWVGWGRRGRRRQKGEKGEAVLMLMLLLLTLQTPSTPHSSPL